MIDVLLVVVVIYLLGFYLEWFLVLLLLVIEWLVSVLLVDNGFIDGIL